MIARTFGHHALCILLAGAAGCAGTGARAARRPAYGDGRLSAAPASLRVTDEQCVRWLGERRTWNAVAIAAASAAVAGGAGSALADEGDGWRIGLGIEVIVLGAVAAGGGALSRSISDDFDRHCTTVPAPAPAAP